MHGQGRNTLAKPPADRPGQHVASVVTSMEGACPPHKWGLTPACSPSELAEWVGRVEALGAPSQTWTLAMCRSSL